MLRYIRKHHQWIIGVLFTVAIPLVLYYLQNQIQPRETKVFYFADEYNSTKSASELPLANCWIKSLSTNRVDAYRCISNKVIEDPCFIDLRDPKILLCPHKLDNTVSYYKIDPTDLPRGNSDELPVRESPQPWYIKLFNGAKCQFLTGATMSVADMRIDYACSANGEVSSLLLPIKQEGDLMRVGCYSNGAVSLCDIDEVWY